MAGESVANCEAVTDRVCNVPVLLGEPAPGWENITNTVANYSII